MTIRIIMFAALLATTAIPARADAVLAFLAGAPPEPTTAQP
jgi:hypothetical protein